MADRQNPGDAGLSLAPLAASPFRSLGSNQVAVFTGHQKEVSCLTWSADRRLLASGAFDHTVCIWDVETQTQINRLEGLTDVCCLAFSPDASWLVTASGAGLCVWDVATGTPVQILCSSSNVQSHPGMVFSLDGSLLAVTEPEPPNEVLGGLQRWRAPEYAVVHIWETATWKPRYHLACKLDGLQRIAFTSGNVLRVGSPTGEIQDWDCSSQFATLPPRMIRRHSPPGELESFNHKILSPFSPDGGVAVLEVHLRFQIVHRFIWPVATGWQVANLEDSQLAEVLAFSSEGRLIAGKNVFYGSMFQAAMAERLRIWESQTGRLVGEVTGHQGNIHAMVFSSDDKLLATAASDASVRIWNLQSLSQAPPRRNLPFIRSLFRRVDACLPLSVAIRFIFLTR